MFHWVSCVVLRELLRIGRESRCYCLGAGTSTPMGGKSRQLCIGKALRYFTQNSRGSSSERFALAISCCYLLLRRETVSLPEVRAAATLLCFPLLGGGGGGGGLQSISFQLPLRFSFYPTVYSNRGAGASMVEGN